MELQERYYPECAFGGYSYVNGTIRFYLRVQSLLRPSDVVLDVGCGPMQRWHSDNPDSIGFKMRMLRGRCQRVIGLDVISSSANNPALDEFRLIEGPRWPVDDASIDLVVTDFVLEHIEDPQQFFSELARVVKPGGYVCVRTPNLYGYVAILSRIIPERFHARTLATAQDKREGIYPTFYRCNTRRRLRSLFSNAGFDADVSTHDSEPSYLKFSRFAYYLGVLHQRYSPAWLRLGILAFARKRGLPASPAS